MATFLIDNDVNYAYDVLLKDINDAKVYYPQFQTNNLYDYFLNLILALLANKPLVLIDSDLKKEEIDNFRVMNINEPFPIDPINSSSIFEIIKSIQASTSEISIFTSGTTGQPKKIIHTIQTLARSVKISEGFNTQTWAFAYNPTHMAGLQVFFQAFENRSSLINVFNQARLQVYDAITKYSITHISATPTFYRLLLPVEKTFDSVKRITFGGERSDDKLYNSILQIFPNAKINNIYASTEAGSLFFAKGEVFQIPESISDKIKVENNELLIHKSLLGKSDSLLFSGDYYHSGDLIEWINEDEGCFRFNSRKNELINIGGYKVNPFEVESAIQLLPDVLQVVVFGRKNSVLGSILSADVKLSESSSLTELDIRDFLSKKLQDFKIPRKINFVESILLTRTGKIKRV